MSETFLAYDVVDVFAASPFAGNQLAVVHGAAELDDAALLAIAREFGYSETTFPTPVDDGRYRIRIFTPGGEIPFAGHPTLGTAWVLRDRGSVAGAEVVQECAAGEIGVRFCADEIVLTAVARDLVGPLDAPAAAALVEELGLTAADLAGDVWLAGTGLTFAHVPVAAEAVARARPGRLRVREITELPATTDPLEGINLYAATGSGAVQVHSRVFVPGLAVPEDPATGSAATGLGLVLVARGVDVSGGYLIRQGAEVGRPSVLTGEVEQRAGAPSLVRVGGGVHRTARGEIRVP